jgi:hypothetical protein
MRAAPSNQESAPGAPQRERDDTPRIAATPRQLTVLDER